MTTCYFHKPDYDRAPGSAPSFAVWERAAVVCHVAMLAAEPARAPRGTSRCRRGHSVTTALYLKAHPPQGVGFHFPEFAAFCLGTEFVPSNQEPSFQRKGRLAHKSQQQV